jgi:hypothetical protein
MSGVEITIKALGKQIVEIHSLTGNASYPSTFQHRLGSRGGYRVPRESPHA